MYLSALYGVTDIDASMARLMRIAGMIIVTPVLFYSGAPFLVGRVARSQAAARRHGCAGGARAAARLAAERGQYAARRGEVYFDSVAMFIFFLSAGRFVEMSVRHRSLNSSEALARSLPAQVTRLLADGNRERVEAHALAVGDRFLVPKGGVVAVDAALPAGLPVEVQHRSTNR